MASHHKVPIVNCENQGKPGHPPHTFGVHKLQDPLLTNLLEHRDNIMSQEPFQGWGFVIKPHVEGEEYQLLCLTCRGKLKSALEIATHALEQEPEEIPEVEDDLLAIPSTPTTTTGIKRLNIGPPGPSSVSSSPKRPRVELETDSIIMGGASSMVQSESGSEWSDHLGEKRAVDLNRQYPGINIQPYHLNIPGKLQKKLEEYQQNLVQTTQDFAHYPFQYSSQCFDCDSLLNGMKNRIDNGNLTRKELYQMLTCLPTSVDPNVIHKVTGVSVHIIKVALDTRAAKGPFSVPNFKSTGHPLDEALKYDVQEFYLRQDVSIISSNSRDTLQIYNPETNEVERVPKRYMASNSRETFQQYCEVNGHLDQDNLPISFTTFKNLKPKFCKWPEKMGQHHVCCCVVHENFRLLLNVIGHNNTSLSTFILQFLCQGAPGPDCFLGFCEVCQDIDDQLIQKLTELEDAAEVQFYQWSSSAENRKMKLERKIMTVEKFQDLLKSQIKEFAAHYFVMKEQQDKIIELIAKLEKGLTVVVTVDFAENYGYIIQKEITGYHWNNDSATLHPFYVQFIGDDGTLQHKTYFALTDSHTHTHASFHILRTEFIKLFKADPLFKDVEKIFYVSDCAPQQYRTKYNYLNLMHHKREFGIDAEWHHSAPNHGKSSCDGMSGVVKRQIRLASLQGKIITNINELVQFCKTTLSKDNMVFFYLPKDQVDRGVQDLLTGRYQHAVKVTGCNSFHSYEVRDSTLVCREFGNSARTFEFKYSSTSVPRPIASFNLNDYVAVIKDKNIVVGAVNEIIENDEDSSIKLQMLKKNRGNSCSLLQPAVYKIFSLTENIRRIELEPTTSTGRTFKINEEMYKEITSTFSK